MNKAHLPANIQHLRHCHFQIVSIFRQNGNSLFGKVHPNKQELLTTNSINNPSTEFNAKFYILKVIFMLKSFKSNYVSLGRHKMAVWLHWQSCQRLMQKVTKITRASQFQTIT